jgi:hypothetical protein
MPRSPGVLAAAPRQKERAETTLANDNPKVIYSAPTRSRSFTLSLRETEVTGCFIAPPGDPFGPAPKALRRRDDWTFRPLLPQRAINVRRMNSPDE